MSSVAVCNGISWETREVGPATAHFSADLDGCSDTVASAIEAADMDALFALSRGEEMLGSGREGIVYALGEDLALKIHRAPWEVTRVNRALEAGLGQVESDFDVSTPHYLAFVSSGRHRGAHVFPTAATVMTRVPGVRLYDLVTSDTEATYFSFSVEKLLLQDLGRRALATVGVDHSDVAWDIVASNFLTSGSTATLAEALTGPLVWLDITTFEQLQAIRQARMAMAPA